VDAIHLSVETGDPYVCLHCSRCVPFCPHECLEMADVDSPPTRTSLHETAREKRKEETGNG
jgi:formate hydrogenlyase subunit 6/NADH:ubiquinone oxidoreductase subunit I